jgi:hypothetical protein
MRGEYPDRVFPILVNGESVGEFRGGRCLSTVFGFHPKGTYSKPVFYDYVGTDPAKSYNYEKIVWPDGWKVHEDEKRKAKRNQKNRELARSKLKPGMFDIEALRDAISCDVEGLCQELFPTKDHYKVRICLGARAALRASTVQSKDGVGSEPVRPTSGEQLTPY